MSTLVEIVFTGAVQVIIFQEIKVAIFHVVSTHKILYRMQPTQYFGFTIIRQQN